MVDVLDIPFTRVLFRFGGRRWEQMSACGGETRETAVSEASVSCSMSMFKLPSVAGITARLYVQDGNTLGPRRVSQKQLFLEYLTYSTATDTLPVALWYIYRMLRRRKVLRFVCLPWERLFIFRHLGGAGIAGFGLMSAVFALQRERDPCCTYGPFLALGVFPRFQHS